MGIARAIDKAASTAGATVALPLIAVAGTLVVVSLLFYAYVNVVIEIWRE